MYLLTYIVLFKMFILEADAQVEPDSINSLNDVIYFNGFELLPLGEDPGIITQDAKISFISNSYMGAWGGLHNYLELSVNASPVAVDLNTVPARVGFGGWYWGMGLSQMTSALDRVESEGDYDTCVFLDSSSLETMRQFADRLFAACTNVVLFVDGGGHNPVSIGANYHDVTENTLSNARIMQTEYPDLLVIPTALIYYELTVNPPVIVPRIDYLYRNDNIHQNGLGTLINAFAMYAVMTSRSPIGIEFTYDQPGNASEKFIQGDNILLGFFDPKVVNDDFIEFNAAVRDSFQLIILHSLLQWKNFNTVFDQ